jgi:hypothetical protein
MDETRFDALAQELASGASRRRMLGGLVGGAAALLTGASLLEAKKGGKGKGKGNGNGKGKGNGNGNGKGRTKVQICHLTDEGTYTLIRVGSPAVKGHSKHGDTVCAAGPCQAESATGCSETGDCTFASANEGGECLTETGETGACVAGACELAQTP